MEILEISYRGVEKTEDIDRLIREKAAKLQKVCNHIMSCRVAVEKTQQHQRRGNPYRVRLDITVPPAHEIVVRREPTEGDIHEEVSQVLRDVFEAARRKLQALAEKERGEVKVHPDRREMAFVVRLFREEGYGFIKTQDDREIYFHRNAVLNHDFGRLEIGTGVRFVETMGEKGPQATTVQIVDKPGATLSEEPAVEAPLGWNP